MLKILLAIVCIVASLPSSSATIYYGKGSSTDYYDEENTAYTLGFFSKDSSGFDIATESKLHDTTSNKDVHSDALSFNILLPDILYEKPYSFDKKPDSSDEKPDSSNEGQSDKFGLSFRFLGGPRMISKSCNKQSNIGYQCYDDNKPDIDYSFNYGGLLYLRLDSLNFGIRVTTVSKQVFLGLHFY
jgi:hypothetical protein